MPFWTVEDAGPYKEKSNFLIRSPLYPDLSFLSMVMVVVMMVMMTACIRMLDMTMLLGAVLALSFELERGMTYAVLL